MSANSLSRGIFDFDDEKAFIFSDAAQRGVIGANKGIWEILGAFGANKGIWAVLSR